MKIWIIILLILCSIHSFSQERIRITHVPSPDSLLPGAYLTLVFKSTVAADSVYAKLEMPEGWQLLSEMRMPTRNGLNWFYSLASPSQSLAGGYTATLFLYSQARLYDSAAVQMTVKEVSRIEIATVTPPPYVKEGDTLVTTFMINNHGNRAEKMFLSVREGSLEKDSAHLAPGESILVRVKRGVPVTGKSGQKIVQSLSVWAKGEAKPYEQHLSVPVYPSQPVKTDNYLRFPVEAGATFLHYHTGNIRSTGYQYFVRGSGGLDFQKRHTLDFELRGPSQRFFPVLGNYDHYAVSYAYKDRFRVTAGDYHLAFNQLMELGRYGRGVMVEMRGEKLAFRALYQTPRLFPAQRDSYGGSVQWIFKSADLSASYFSKEIFQRKQWFTSRMLGLSARIKKRTLQWEAEAAWGKALGQYDVGAFHRLQYGGRKLSFSNQTIYAGKNFFGFYTNSRLLVSNIGYNFHPKAAVGVSHNYMLINPSLDVTVFSASPFTNTFMAYFTFLPDTRHRFFLHYHVGRRKDRQAPSTYDFYENTGNFFYTFEGRRMRWNHQARYGYTRNNLLQEDGFTGPRQTYASTHVQPSIRLGKGMWLGGFAEYQYTSRFSVTDQHEHLFFWGGNLSMLHKKAFQFNLAYRNSYAPDELYESRSFLNLSARLDLNQHRFTLQGGNVYYPNPELRHHSTLFFALTYTLGLNLPIARKKNVGRVVGKLTGTGISTEGMLIRLGGYEYLTNAQGDFVFNHLVEDRYLLTLHHLQGSKGIVPVSGGAAMEVQVRKDSVTNLVIPLSKTGGVQGRVAFETESRNGTPTVLLQLYNEHQSYLTDLKEEGVFSFKEILPGNWKLKVILHDPAYEVDIAEHDVTISTDKISEVRMTIRPKTRKIFFSNQNFQISLKK